MLNNELISNALRFVVLVFIQVLLLNNINLAGFINPYIYILFILLYPFDGNRGLLIFSSFLLGLSIDIFQGSGGVHAAASVFTAYIRPVVLKYSFGVSYEYNSVKLNTSSPTERFAYIASIVLFHHLVMFSLEIFSFSHMVLLSKSILFSGIFTLVIIYGSLVLFNKKTS